MVSRAPNVQAQLQSGKVELTWRVKLFSAIATYLALALMLCAGILQAVHGSYWLLIIGTLGYLALLVGIGCLPGSSAEAASAHSHPSR